jgi:hypothetical protein
MKIYNAQPEVYLDEELSRPIKVFKALHGGDKDAQYIGTASFNVPGYGPMESPFRIEADSLTHAFEAYDDAYAVEAERVNKQIEEQMKAAEAEESKLIVPDNDVII